MKTHWWITPDGVFETLPCEFKDCKSEADVSIKKGNASCKAYCRKHGEELLTVDRKIA